MSDLFNPLATHKFLASLQKNNSKTWMDDHREEYQELRKGLVVLAEEIHAQMIGLDPSLVGMDPRKSLFRINRDIRFSANKQPYKTHMGAKFSATGRKKGIAGYGFGVSADGHLYIMGGINKLPTADLNKIRDGIVAPDSKLWSVIQSKDFQQYFRLTDLGFGQLKTVPRGYDKNHPAADILKLQALWAMAYIPVSEVPDHEQVIKTTLPRLADLVDFVQEINRLLH